MELFRLGRLWRLVLLLLALSCCVLASPQARRQRNRARRRHRHGGGSRQYITAGDALIALEAHKKQTDGTLLPDTLNENISPAEREAAMAQLRPDVLKSSRKARLITKRRYLKQDWCKTEPLVRRLREPGCRSKRVLDRFCYGQCNSFYIPREDRRGSRGSGKAFQSCAFCQPRRWKRVAVLFRCPGKVPAQRRRRVRLVHKCTCSTEKPRR